MIVQSTFVSNCVAVSNESVKDSHSPSSSTTPESYHGLHSYLEHSTANIRHTVTLTHSDHDAGFIHGGVIAMLESLLTIHSSVFTNNMNRDHDGGEFSISNKVILDSVFYDNHALGSGGVMSVFALSHVTMENCTVHNSRSKQGGAIAVSRSVIITIKSSEFSNNSAVAIAGGVIMADLNSHLTLVSSKFTDNKAAVSGGALYALNTRHFLTTLLLLVEDCT